MLVRPFSLNSPDTIRRLRAVIQKMNEEFSAALRTIGHKYHIEKLAESGDLRPQADTPPAEENVSPPPRAVGAAKPGYPKDMSIRRAQDWISPVLIRTRGREFPGNFNP
jgi:hypothetical protein